MLTHFDSTHDHLTACGELKAVTRVSTDYARVTCGKCWSLTWEDIMPEACNAASVPMLQAEVRERLTPIRAWARLEERRANEQ